VRRAKGATVFWELWFAHLEMELQECLIQVRLPEGDRPGGAMRNGRGVGDLNRVLAIEDTPSLASRTGKERPTALSAATGTLGPHGDGCAEAPAYPGLVGSQVHFEVDVSRGASS
jgi:hypothetical protein